MYTGLNVLPRPATMCIPNHIVFWCIRAGLRVTCMCTPEYIGVYTTMSVTKSHAQKMHLQDIDVCRCDTKTRIGRQCLANPSFGMTTTNMFKGAFLRHTTLYEVL